MTAFADQLMIRYMDPATAPTVPWGSTYLPYVEDTEMPRFLASPRARDPSFVNSVESVNGTIVSFSALDAVNIDGDITQAAIAQLSTATATSPVDAPLDASDAFSVLRARPLAQASEMELADADPGPGAAAIPVCP